MNARWMNPKGWVGLLLVLATAGWLMGMGGGSESDAGKIPIPEKNYSVRVADSGGNSLQAQRFTWEGKVFFQARYGNATITLPFEKVAEFTVTSASMAENPAMMEAEVILKSGETLSIQIERDSKVYGETSFGNYEIFLKDVGSIAFL